jgi:hypothetical protein
MKDTKIQILSNDVVSKFYENKNGIRLPVSTRISRNTKPNRRYAMIFQALMKSERFPCGCFIEWDGKKVAVNICEWHRTETKRLKLK